MKTRAGSMVILSLAVGFAAAQQASPYEQALQQVIDSFDTIGTTLKTIVDEETAAGAKPTLRKSSDAFLEARAKATKMQPPEKAEKERLEKTYKPKLEAAMKKMFTEVFRVKEIPGGKDALKEISSVLKKDEK
jgi:uncharacterized protein YnzC (UPF0291/DUF896 family)